MELVRLPSVKVGAYTYGVDEVSSHHPSKGTDNCGATSHETQTVFVDSAIHEEQKDDTYIHELGHIVLRTAGFDEEINCSQEELIRRITPYIYLFIKDNPILRP